MKEIKMSMVIGLGILFCLIPCGRAEILWKATVESVSLDLTGRPSVLKVGEAIGFEYSPLFSPEPCYVVRLSEMGEESTNCLCESATAGSLIWVPRTIGVHSFRLMFLKGGTEVAASREGSVELWDDRLTLGRADVPLRQLLPTTYDRVSHVALESGVTAVPDELFAGCTNLASVTVPASVAQIGAEAFVGCTGLRHVEMLSDGAAETVEVTIPNGVKASNVTVTVSTTVKTVRANGAKVRVVCAGHDITSLLDIPGAVDGVIAVSNATVKASIVREALDTARGAVIDFSNPSEPIITTSDTRPGLTYTLREGISLQCMKDGASKQGDGRPWMPVVTVKGGASGFYTIKVGK